MQQFAPVFFAVVVDVNAFIYYNRYSNIWARNYARVYLKNVSY